MILPLRVWGRSCWKAISRGAKFADFVEFRPASLHALKANVVHWKGLGSDGSDGRAGAGERRLGARGARRERLGLWRRGGEHWQQGSGPQVDAES